MMVLLYIISGLILFLLIIMVSPFQIIINTTTKKYYIGLRYIIGIRMLVTNGVPTIRLHILFIRISFKKIFGTKSRTLKAKKYRIKKTSTSKPFRWSKLKAVLYSIKVRKLYANIDTGNYPLNAQLLPVAQLASNKNINIEINFNTINTLQCKLETRPIILMWNIIKSN